MSKIDKRKRKSVSYHEDSDYEDDYGDSDYEGGLTLKLKRKKGSRSSSLSKLPAASLAQLDEEPLVAGVFQDFSHLILKPDHEQRPIWVTKNNLIFLEAFSPLYQQACDFLVAIAEPEARPRHIHTYRLTENSLYAAVAVSISTESIVKVLGRLCKTQLPEEVVRFVRDSTYTFGKAKVVLRENSFFIESKYPEVLRELLRNPIIRDARDHAVPTSI
ncbi:hypothetical protein EON64_19475, partial [archaeon]